MSRVQQTINIFELAISAPEWDALADANFSAIQKFLSTWEMTEADNTITIQLQDANGDDVLEEHYLRVKLCDGTGYTVAAASQFNVTTGTTVETFTANKDLVIKSNASGIIKIQLTLSATTTTSEPVVGIIRIGPPSVSARIGDYSNTLTVS
jgi:acetamidase/formamidase